MSAETAGAYGSRGETQAKARSAMLGYATKAEIAYRRLREDLIRGRWGPGDRLVVDQMSEEFGVSRVPVREAVIRLVGEGWLDLQPHVGPIVPSPSRIEIEETAVLRAVLESEAVARAAPHVGRAELVVLQGVLDDMDAAVSDTSRDFPALNKTFHTLTIGACPIRLLSRTAGEMMERTMRYHTVYRVPEYLKGVQVEHRRILEALAAHDSELSATLARDHILSAARALAARLSEG